MASSRRASQPPPARPAAEAGCSPWPCLCRERRHPAWLWLPLPAAACSQCAAAARYSAAFLPILAAPRVHRRPSCTSLFGWQLRPSAPLWTGRSAGVLVDPMPMALSALSPPSCRLLKPSADPQPCPGAPLYPGRISLWVATAHLHSLVCLQHCERWLASFLVTGSLRSTVRTCILRAPCLAQHCMQKLRRARVSLYFNAWSASACMLLKPCPWRLFAAAPW